MMKIKVLYNVMLSFGEMLNTISIDCTTFTSRVKQSKASHYNQSKHQELLTQWHRVTSRTL